MIQLTNVSYQISSIRFVSLSIALQDFCTVDFTPSGPLSPGMSTSFKLGLNLFQWYLKKKMCKFHHQIWPNCDQENVDLRKSFLKLWLIWHCEFSFENMIVKIYHWNLTLKIWHSNSDLQNLTFKIWPWKYDIQILTFKIWPSKSDCQNLTFKIWPSKSYYDKQSLKADIDNLTSKIWPLKYLINLDPMFDNEFPS